MERAAADNAKQQAAMQRSGAQAVDQQLEQNN
jgi:hypothetical protein